MKKVSTLSYLGLFQADYDFLHEKVALAMSHGETIGCDTHRVMVELGKLLYHQCEKDGTFKTVELDQIIETAMIFSLQAYGGQPVWEDWDSEVEYVTKNSALIDVLFVLNYAEYLKLAQSFVNATTNMRIVPDAADLVHEVHQKFLRTMREKKDFDIKRFSMSFVGTSIKRLLIDLIKREPDIHGFEHEERFDTKPLTLDTVKPVQKDPDAFKHSVSEALKVDLIFESERSEDLFKITTWAIADVGLSDQFLKLYFSKRMLFFAGIIWLPEMKKREQLLEYLREELKFFAEVSLWKIENLKSKKVQKKIATYYAEPNNASLNSLRKVLENEIFRIYKGLLNLTTDADVECIIEALISEVKELDKKIKQAFQTHGQSAEISRSHFQLCKSALYESLRLYKEKDPGAISTFILKDLLNFDFVEIARLRWGRKKVSDQEIRKVTDERVKIINHVKGTVIRRVQ